MTAIIAVPPHYDLVAIARAAGQPDPNALKYLNDELHVEGVEQEALDAAYAAYSHADIEKVQAKSRIASRRYDVEGGGIKINGAIIETNRESQSLISGAALQSLLVPEYVVRWKTPAGFIELNGTMIVYIATEVRKHVQACFDREEELTSAVDNDTFTEEMLDQGWPETAYKVF